MKIKSKFLLLVLLLTGCSGTIPNPQVAFTDIPKYNDDVAICRSKVSDQRDSYAAPGAWTGYTPVLAKLSGFDAQKAVNECMKARGYEIQ